MALKNSQAKASMHRFKIILPRIEQHSGNNINCNSHADHRHLAPLEPTHNNASIGIKGKRKRSSSITTTTLLKRSGRPFAPSNNYPQIIYRLSAPPPPSSLNAPSVPGYTHALTPQFIPSEPFVSPAPQIPINRTSRVDEDGIEAAMVLLQLCQREHIKKRKEEDRAEQGNHEHVRERPENQDRAERGDGQVH